jgi:hypothetical protein
MRPSFLLSIISSMLLLVATLMSLIFLIYKAIYSEPINVSELIKFLFIAAIAYGIHGLQHSNEEIYFNYNPFKTSQWFSTKDEVQPLPVKTV